MLLTRGQPNALEHEILRNFDETFAQLQSRFLVYGLSIHAFLVGQRFRLRSFGQAMKHILENREDVRFVATGQITGHHAGMVPPPEQAGRQRKSWRHCLAVDLFHWPREGVRNAYGN